MARDAAAGHAPDVTDAARRAKRAGRGANRQLAALTGNAWFGRVARVGYIVRGALYGAMGVIAMALAMEGHGDTTDQSGALHLLGGNLFGRILLVIVIVALAAYSLWGFLRAVYDPLGRGDSPTGIASRIGFAWSGLNYAALMVFAAGMLFGTTRRTGDPVQRLVQAVLARPGGGILIILAGVIGIAAGLGQFVDAYKAGFRKDLKRTQMTKTERTTADALGRFGMVSRGVIFTIVGIFIFAAGLQHNAGDAHGFGAAFEAVTRAPLGRALLGVVALGFIALGLHSWANARWVRMPKGHAPG